MTDPIEAARGAVIQAALEWAASASDGDGCDRLSKAAANLRAVQVAPECRPPAGTEPGPWVLRQVDNPDCQIVAAWTGSLWVTFASGLEIPANMGQRGWRPFARAVPAVERREYSDDEARALWYEVWRGPMTVADAIPIFARALLAGKVAADFGNPEEKARS